MNSVAACFMLVYWLVYSSALEMEEICFSETSVDIQETTKRCIPEDRNLHNHRSDNLRSYIGLFWKDSWPAETLLDIQEALISTELVNSSLILVHSRLSFLRRIVKNQYQGFVSMIGAYLRTSPQKVLLGSD
jgi:hypothetical protein